MACDTSKSIYSQLAEFLIHSHIYDWTGLQHFFYRATFVNLHCCRSVECAVQLLGFLSYFYAVSNYRTSKPWLHPKHSINSTTMTFGLTSTLLYDSLDLVFERYIVRFYCLVEMLDISSICLSLHKTLHSNFLQNRTPRSYHCCIDFA